jgi:type II secretory pathway component PulF
MPTFAYQARNQAGERVAGTSEAPDQRAALESLRESGLFVTQLAPAYAGERRTKHGAAFYTRSRYGAASTATAAARTATR